MGLLNQIRNAANGGEKELQELLLDNEKPEKLFTAKEDFCAITDRRLIFIDKDLMTKKKAVTGTPYSKISSVSLKRGGALSFQKEVIVQIGSREVEIELYDKNQALELFKSISEKII